MRFSWYSAATSGEHVPHDLLAGLGDVSTTANASWSMMGSRELRMPKCERALGQAKYPGRLPLTLWKLP